MSKKKISMLLLAAGKGTRLRPYTNEWPKCLMPINGKPLLQYWLEAAKILSIEKVLVNLHYQSEIVQSFLSRPSLKDWIQTVHEEELLGTAGTLRANERFFSGYTILLVHADNFCQCNFKSFIHYHINLRPANTDLTMMTFDAGHPESCGIVETDHRGIVTAFHEKVANPPGRQANGAVYLLEPQVLDWIIENPEVIDFSTEVIPEFIGRIATWHNPEIHIDIGNIQALRLSQNVARTACLAGSDKSLGISDEWMRIFAEHPIHHEIAELKDELR